MNDYIDISYSILFILSPGQQWSGIALQVTQRLKTPVLVWRVLRVKLALTLTLHWASVTVTRERTPPEPRLNVPNAQRVSHSHRRTHVILRRGHIKTECMATHLEKREIREKSGKNTFDEKVWEKSGKFMKKLSKSGKSWEKCLRKCWHRAFYCHILSSYQSCFFLYCRQIGFRENIVSQRKVREN